MIYDKSVNHMEITMKILIMLLVLGFTGLVYASACSNATSDKFDHSERSPESVTPHN
jgi:hypothetical protein